MPRDFQSLLIGAAVIVTVHEVAAPGSGPDIRRRYGFTGRETELLGHMLEGRSLADAAAAMAISLSTARQYVKQLMAKTHTHRQAELIALLVRLGH